MTDVIISPSSQTTNQYAGGGTGVADSEHRHMRDIAPMLDDLLVRNGIDSKILWDTDLATRIRQSNANPPLLHFALHSNAGGSSLGAGCFIYQRGTKSEIMAREIQKELAAITPWPDLGVIQYNHYETRETTSYAVIMEVAFHDKVEGAEWIRTHKREIAIALTRGTINALAAAYGGRFVDIAARPLILDAGTGSAPVVIAPTPTPTVPEEDQLTPEQARQLQALADRIGTIDQLATMTKQLWDRRALIDQIGAVGVDAATIAALIPDALAAKVADLLAARLSS